MVSRKSDLHKIIPVLTVHIYTFLASILKSLNDVEEEKGGTPEN